MPSNAARATCAAVVPRVTPASKPRAYGSQCGAPNPANAGTRYTPPVSSTCAASASTSDDDLMMPSPSRSQCTTAPAMKMLRSEEHTSELQSQSNLVCRLLLEKKKKKDTTTSLITHPKYLNHHI